MDCIVYCAQSSIGTLNHNFRLVCFTDLMNLLTMTLVGTFKRSKQRNVQHTKERKIASLERNVRFYEHWVRTG